MKKFFLLSIILLSINSTMSREIVFSNHNGTKIIISENQNPKNYLRNLWQIHEFRRRSIKKKLSKNTFCEEQTVDMRWDEIKTQRMKLCLKIPFHKVFYTKMTADIK